MTTLAIEAIKLRKRYRVGETQALYGTLRDTIAGRFRSTRRQPNAGAETADVLWALDGVSFEISSGETVGIVGGNGAGKTTLLKVLSRITPPTEGQAILQGRLGSLLEAGAGFHPELTGRENVYLSGAMLGMRRAGTRARFNDIVEFAGVSRHIDTPVKRYSSGMFVRLAFAVAAHLDCDIMIVDEILAVGDGEFQRRSHEKLLQLGTSGRTIVFVSHNLSAVQSLCTRGILLERGKVVADGKIDSVLDAYRASSRRAGNEERSVAADTKTFYLRDVQIFSDAGAITTFGTMTILLEVEAKTDVGQPGAYLGFLDTFGRRIAGIDYRDFAAAMPMDVGERKGLRFTVRDMPLLPGSYILEIHLKDMSLDRVEFVPRHFPFEVATTAVYGGRELDSWFGVTGLHVEVEECRSERRV